MAAPLSLSQDTRKVNKKGRVAFKYKTGFGGPDENELEIMGYGAQKEFQKVDNEYFYFIHTVFARCTFQLY